MNRRPFKFERIIDIEPISSKKDEDTQKGFMTTIFILKTKKNAVTFSISSVIFWKNGLFWRNPPSTEFLCYHSQKQLHKWDVEHEGKCPFTGNGKCYSEQDSALAEECLNAFIEKGSDAVWEMMEQYYIKIFGEKKAIYEHI